MERKNGSAREVAEDGDVDRGGKEVREGWEKRIQGQQAREMGGLT